MHSAWKGCLWSDLCCVGQNVKPYSLTYFYVWVCWLSGLQQQLCLSSFGLLFWHFLIFVDYVCWVFVQLPPRFFVVLLVSCLSLLWHCYTVGWLVTAACYSSFFSDLVNDSAWFFTTCSENLNLFCSSSKQLLAALCAGRTLAHFTTTCKLTCIYLQEDPVVKVVVPSWVSFFVLNCDGVPTHLSCEC